jgi:hypothetical protein
LQANAAAMYVTQQGNNTFITDAGRQSLLLQQSAGMAQQQAQGWATPAGSNASVVFTSAGFAPQGQQSIVYQQQPQQVRMVQPQFQQQNVIMAGPQQVLMPRANPAVESQKPVVFVNVNGTLQRGVLQNGSVYLLANDGVGPQIAGNNPQLCQVSAVQQTIGSQALSFQPQQPVMIQQVLPNGQLVPVSGALVAPRAGVQMPVVQQQPQMQVQMQARPMQAVSVSMGMNLQMQQQAGMQMAQRAGPTMPAPGRVIQANTGPQQQVLLQLPQGSVMQAAGAPTMRPAMAASGQGNMSVNSVSANTASLMPRIVNGTVSGVQGMQRLAPVASQPMTIAAALAALPSNPAGSTAGPKRELSSPVAPPGTPGMGNEAAAAGSDVGTIGAMISKLSAPAQPAPARTTVISAPPAVSQAGSALAGSSPLTSQPGTPSRSNSVGANSSSSSCNSAGSQAAQSDGDHEGKLGVMRMFARTFIETGIGLEQALGMIQPADREMLAAAFAAEAAAAASSKAQSAAGDGASPTAADDSIKAAAPCGLSDLGGEQVSMPPMKGGAPGPAGVLQLSNTTDSSAVDGTQGAGQDNFSLGSWGFSLFSSVTSDLGSNQGGSSFGGVGDKVTAASTAATATDSATATLFANLHV